MKVTSVTVSNGVKANLGNYSSATFHYTLGAELDSGESPDAVRVELEQLIDEWIREKLASVKQANGVS